MAQTGRQSATAIPTAGERQAAMATTELNTLKEAEEKLPMYAKDPETLRVQWEGVVIKGLNMAQEVRRPLPATENYEERLAEWTEQSERIEGIRRAMREGEAEPHVRPLRFEPWSEGTGAGYTITAGLMRVPSDARQDDVRWMQEALFKQSVHEENARCAGVLAKWYMDIKCFLGWGGLVTSSTSYSYTARLHGGEKDVQRRDGVRRRMGIQDAEFSESPNILPRPQDAQDATAYAYDDNERADLDDAGG